jgi:hypothetical protein
VAARLRSDILGSVPDTSAATETGR